MKDILEFLVIYENPSDYPGQFVVRGQIAQSDGTVRPDALPLCVVDTLEEARGFIPSNKFRVPRSVGDEPQIVETWF